jgi:transposase InsO family protein
LRWHGSDLTYVRIAAGWVCAAVILDVYARLIVGWQVATSPYTYLAGLIHHSERGVQYRTIRYTQRLADAGTVASVGSKRDSYDNAMAEAFTPPQAELVRTAAPGSAWTNWKSPPSSTSTGTTTGACTANSDTSTRRARSATR